MMLRSPLPAAAASHTASHVSLPLFFFFLTSARGGAATARPLTSPPLARPRPGGRGGGGPGASASPGPGGLGLRRGGAAGRDGGGRRGRAGGACGASLEGAEGSAPAAPARPGGGVQGPGARLAWGEGAARRLPGCRAAASRRLLSPPLDPSAPPGLKAATLRLREKGKLQTSPTTRLTASFLRNQESTLSYFLRLNLESPLGGCSRGA
ncbi:uncharacterized protein LOC142876355 [Microcebus murinus]|uniref:uncharacterized protein LOC142876355 n=1 Tax=Microcebus murinus TaxID=30608 RepID=UPI003F6BF92A